MQELEKKLNYQFKNKELLNTALTHKSFANEKKVKTTDNEKLEFLGDAVLDLVVGELLMNIHINDTEGELSKKRASLVNEEELAEMSTELGIPEQVKLGRGEVLTSGNLRPSILAGTLEAVFGAIYLDGGFLKSRKVISNLFELKIKQASLLTIQEFDYKSLLQEYVQRDFKVTPEYVLKKEEGSSHDKIFHVDVLINNKVVARGSGKSKKLAQKEAAHEALKIKYGVK